MINEHGSQIIFEFLKIVKWKFQKIFLNIFLIGNQLYLSLEKIRLNGYFFKNKIESE